MSEKKTVQQKLSAYNEKTRDLMAKIRDDINENNILKLLEERYDVDELLLFNEFDIKEKSETNPYKQKEFKLLFLNHSGNLQRLRDKLETETGKKYQAIKEGDVALTKQEIEKYYLPCDEELIKLKGKIAKLEIVVKYFEIVHKAFESQQWNIKVWEQLSKGGW